MKQLIRVGLRKCYACQKIYELSEANFYTSKNKKGGGFQYACKVCNNERSSVYHKANIEKVRLWTRKSRNKRKGIFGNGVALKTRFEIFIRDKFTCQYCGRKSPEAILQIDHIIPKSKGGEDYSSNYITACKDCNNGKLDMILNTSLNNKAI